ncbi:MAG: DedA protein [Acidimicrobiales bacterium]|nr:DedA protein [Acidimicrobiales bacterium]
MNLDLAHLAALSEWIYVMVFAVVALDAVLPVMPSESIVVTAGVLAARGDGSLPLVILAAAAGAVAGDGFSFLIGHRYRNRRLASAAAGKLTRGLTGRTGKAVRWAEGMLEEHGPGTLIVSRFIPGGRTATTFTAGFVGMRARAFGASIVTGAILWAGQAGLIGFAGGHLFEDNLLLGIGLGVGSGMLVGVLIELVRHRLANRNATPASSGGAVLDLTAAALPTADVAA